MKSPGNLLCACFSAGLLVACGGSNVSMPATMPVAPRSAARQSTGSMSPSNGYMSVYSFKGGRSGDGSEPLADLTVLHGTLYGTTEYGGSGCNRLDCGTVFAITPARSESVLYDFEGGSDGQGPEAGLIEVKGQLYGTTRIGGRRAYGGTVFRITPSGTETVLHRFVDNDARQPLADLIDVRGVFYGTTSLGGSGCSGSTGCGALFKISTSGTGYELLYSFKGGRDGNSPGAPLLDVNSALYGTTYGGGLGCNGVGCGTIFETNASGHERVVYRFKGAPDGASPSAGLINVNGMLYGTTYFGGSRCKSYGGCGTVFVLNPSSGKERIIYSFAGGVSGQADGANPSAGLIAIGRVLYGTTSDGGAYSGPYAGTVFSITTSGKETVLHSFGGSGDGTSPNAGLINVKGTLYGTTAFGGTNGDGTVFSLTP